MATFDEAFSAAASQLAQSGMLANDQLLTLADRDEETARTVRDALIEKGIADDRLGVALTLASDRLSIEPSVQRSFTTKAAPHTEEIVFAAADDEMDSANEWWLMKSGVAKGPFDFPTLRQKRALGEILGSDLVRHTERGYWQRPEEIAGLEDVSITVPSAKPAVPDISTRSLERHPDPAPLEIDRETRTASDRRTDRDLPVVRREIHVSVDKAGYFLWDSGKPVGPFARSELEARLRSGNLSGEDFVQIGHDGDWQPISLALTGQQSSLGSRLSLLVRRGASTEDLAGETNRSHSSKSQAIQVSDSFARRAQNGPATNLKANSRTQSSVKIARAQGKSLSTNEQRLIARSVDRAAGLAGGRRRLIGMVMMLSVGVGALIWWQQPPSDKTIHLALDECYQAVTKLQLKQTQAGDVSSDLARIQTRVCGIRDTLKKRASSQRPAEQELLWACDYGLLPMMKEPAASRDHERAYFRHMERAEETIDPKTKSHPLNETSGAPPVVSRSEK